MSDCDCCRLIPGPDPGACPDCGHWRAAGMVHSCAASEAAWKQQMDRMFGAYPFTEETK